MEIAINHLLYIVSIIAVGVPLFGLATAPAIVAKAVLIMFGANSFALIEEELKKKK